MAGTTVPPIRDAGQIKALLDSPEVASLIAELEATRWTGRPGYPIRAMAKGQVPCSHVGALCSPLTTRPVGAAAPMQEMQRAGGRSSSMRSSCASVS